MPTRRQRVTSMVLAATVVAGLGFGYETVQDDPVTAAPTVSATPAPEDEAPPVEELSGDFLVSGSSTVFPIVQLQAERFQDLAPGVAVAVEGPGSGDGARKFCAGEVPIANASRLYKDEEIADCVENGIEFIEIRRAVDGITVITAPENDAIECVTFNELYALLSEEATGHDSWADANALLAEIGSSISGLPDAPLAVFGPGEESGTFDSFAEIVIESVAKGKTGLDTDGREFTKSIRPDYTSSPDDNIILAGIESSRYSLGWVGYAFASEAIEAGTARAIPVAVTDDDLCVSPNEETIATATFPISRFLYTYVNAAAAADDPAVAAFVDYMLSDEGLTAVEEVGYVALENRDLNRANTVWRARLTGTGQWSEE